MTYTDNDSGSKQIMKLLKNPDLSSQFYHFLENLYIVSISSGSGTKQMAIEDLFDEKILETIVAGKKFNRNPKIDSATEYGKIVFAEKVIKANQDSPRFFSQLLRKSITSTKQAFLVLTVSINYQSLLVCVVPALWTDACRPAL